MSSVPARRSAEAPRGECPPPAERGCAFVGGRAEKRDLGRPPTGPGCRAAPQAGNRGTTENAANSRSLSIPTGPASISKDRQPGGIKMEPAPRHFSTPPVDKLLPGLRAALVLLLEAYECAAQLRRD